TARPAPPQRSGAPAWRPPAAPTSLWPWPALVPAELARLEEGRPAAGVFAAPAPRAVSLPEKFFLRPGSNEILTGNSTKQDRARPRRRREPPQRRWPALRNWSRAS